MCGSRESDVLHGAHLRAELLPGVVRKGPSQQPGKIDDFVFDNQMLAQIVWYGYRIGELSCPTKYFEEASSINFRRSVTYGLGVLKTALQFRFQRLGLVSSRIFPPVE